MTVFAFGAAKGAPGVTTTVLALAARWPHHREPLVIEADPAGGDLVVRLASLDGDAGGLRDTPSTVQLAAASRSGLSPQGVLGHLQRLPGPGEVRALVAPSSPFAASTALRALTGAGLVDVLERFTTFDALVDVGRLDAASPALDAVSRLGAVALVIRPTLAGVLHTRELVRSLATLGVRASLVVIGDRPYGPAEVADAVGAGLFGVLPDDPVGAWALLGDPVSTRAFARARLVRAAGDLAAGLPPPPSPADDELLSATGRATSLPTRRGAAAGATPQGVAP